MTENDIVGLIIFCIFGIPMLGGAIFVAIFPLVVQYSHHVGRRDILWRMTRHKISQDHCGELWQGWSFAGETTCVMVRDNGGIHWLRVPNHMRNAIHAVAWTYRMLEDEYNPTVRR